MPAWPATAGSDERFLERAATHAGGWPALTRAKVLRWTGTAKLVADGQIIDIGLSTTVRPFQSARSDTWLVSEGPTQLRSLILDGDQGWTERGGVRTPMPPAQARHEQAQYTLYGLMLLTPLADPRAALRVDTELGEVAVDYPGAPPTVLTFDATGRLTRARNTVPAPDGVGTLRQDIRFDGEITGGGLRWPRRMGMAQDGKPYLDLTISRFAAGPD